MNQRIVARVVLLLALAFALACGGFALRVRILGDSVPPPRAGAAPTAQVETTQGQALWQSHCARCHQPSEFGTRLQGAQRFASFGELLRKLDTHGDLDTHQDFEVIQWLASQPAAAAETTGEAQEDDYRL